MTTFHLYILWSVILHPIPRSTWTVDVKKKTESSNLPYPRYAAWRVDFRRVICVPESPCRSWGEHRSDWHSPEYTFEVDSFCRRSSCPTGAPWNVPHCWSHFCLRPHEDSSARTFRYYCSKMACGDRQRLSTAAHEPLYRWNDFYR